jgi:hypothetical protein
MYPIIDEIVLDFVLPDKRRLKSKAILHEPSRSMTCGAAHVEDV